MDEAQRRLLLAQMLMQRGGMQGAGDAVLATNAMPATPAADVVGRSRVGSLTNPSSDFSPLANPAYMTSEQKLGAFWNAATGRAKPYTNADLPQLTKAGQEAYDAAAGFVNLTNPIRAYHGSPHTFDRFDMSKIGTGEGAQAYGHGLYFAGNEKVARSYRDTLTPPGMRVTAPDGGSVIAAPGSPQFFEPLVAALKDVPAPDYIKRALARAYSEGASDLSAATIKNAFGDMALSADDLARAKQTVNQLVADAKPVLSAFKIERPGSMYEVNLRTTPERLLDWDKPLSQQPAAVREAVQSLPYADAPWVANSNSPMLALEDARSAWMQKQGMDTRGNQMHRMNISRDLANSGLDGIQYLDAGSRAAGEVSRNYVMFDDKLIDILRRYALIGLLGGGATSGATAAAPRQ